MNKKDFNRYSNVAVFLSLFFSINNLMKIRNLLTYGKNMNIMYMNNIIQHIILYLMKGEIG